MGVAWGRDEGAQTHEEQLQVLLGSGDLSPLWPSRRRPHAGADHGLDVICPSSAPRVSVLFPEQQSCTEFHILQDFGALKI